MQELPLGLPADVLQRDQPADDITSCGNGPNLWISMQQAYDLWHA
jgi:hypothetical protein